jgi:hypothetical protein
MKRPTRSEQIVSRITKAEYKDVKKITNRHSVTISDYIRRLVLDDVTKFTQRKRGGRF